MHVEKSLKAIYDHLADGGIFLFEAETLHAVPQAGIWRGLGMAQTKWPKNYPKPACHDARQYLYQPLQI
ncbi:Uncharacterised protein [Orientia tsutsugamushi]|nr:Uncharacterised protein [Orientia tsutsugamushi]